MQTNLSTFWCLLFSLWLVLVATADAEYALQVQSLEGEVWYRERIVLPQGSEMVVALQDVAKMDVPARVIASKRFPLVGGPPYPFELQFEKKDLDPQGRYALLARIEHQGNLLFINTEHNSAFSAPDGEAVRVLVESIVGRPTTNEADHSPDASLRNTYWRLLEMKSEPVTSEAGQREMHFVLDDQQKIRAFTGCNLLRGEYAQTGDQLLFPLCLRNWPATGGALCVHPSAAGAFLNSR